MSKIERVIFVVGVVLVVREVAYVSRILVECFADGEPLKHRVKHGAHLKAAAKGTYIVSVSRVPFGVVMANRRRLDFAPKIGDRSADAEIHFAGGELDGLMLVGFSVCKSPRRC